MAEEGQDRKKVWAVEKVRDLMVDMAAEGMSLTSFITGYIMFVRCQQENPEVASLIFDALIDYLEFNGKDGRGMRAKVYTVAEEVLADYDEQVLLGTFFDMNAKG